jgi:hypothetical protein
VFPTARRRWQARSGARLARLEAGWTIAFRSWRTYLNGVEVTVTLRREGVVELLMQAAPYEFT